MEVPQPEKQKRVPLAEVTQEKTVPALENLLARVAELKRDLLDRERDCTLARKQIKAMQEVPYIKRLNELLTEREAALEACKKALEDCHRDVRDLRAALVRVAESKSWKVTAPIRFLTKVWRDTCQFTRRIGGLHTENENAGGEFGSVPETLQTSEIADQHHSLDRDTGADETVQRAEIVEEALLGLFESLEDTSGNGRYVHNTAHNMDTRLLSVKTIAFYRPYSSPGYDSSPSGVLSNWTAVSTALPRYLGQYQPHVPDSLGYYDLRVSNVLRKQIELANQYGIYGFCFQFGALKEIKSSDLPLAQLLSDSTLEISFCISCEVMSAEDLDDQVIELQNPGNLQFLRKIFTDRRYVQIDGKPLLILSGVRDEASGRIWRHQASTMGLPDLYLVARCESSFSGTLVLEFDAIIEDPTLGVDINAVPDVPLIDSKFRGGVYSYPEIMERYSVPTEAPCVVLRNVVTNWDTEPTNPGKSFSFAGSSPAMYARWLERCCRHTMRHRPQERLVFVSSWNDWAAGAHLEPDHRFGYAYLNATANVLRSYYYDESTEILVNDINAEFRPSSDTAIVFHCYHEDLISPIFEEYLSKVSETDLFVTARADISSAAIKEMRKRFPNIFFDLHENRGRDVRPFLFALRRIQSLGYKFACKVHTKKTPHAGDGGGELWRQTLMKTLLGAPDCRTQVLRQFHSEKDLGLLVPLGSLMDLHELRHHIDNIFWLDRLLGRINRTDLIENYAFPFPAGSMYWFRVDALAGLDDLVLSDDAFEQELGQRDGTLAHALERLIVLYALQKGYRTEEIDLARQAIPNVPGELRSSVQRRSS